MSCERKGDTRGPRGGSSRRGWRGHLGARRTGPRGEEFSPRRKGPFVIGKKPDPCHSCVRLARTLPSAQSSRAARRREFLPRPGDRAPPAGSRSPQGTALAQTHTVPSHEEEKAGWRKCTEPQRPSGVRKRPARPQQGWGAGAGRKGKRVARKGRQEATPHSAPTAPAGRVPHGSDAGKAAPRGSSFRARRPPAQGPLTGGSDGQNHLANGTEAEARTPGRTGRRRGAGRGWGEAGRGGVGRSVRAPTTTRIQ